MELRVWFGEDLKNWAESDNQGRVCVDVFGYVIGDIGASAGGSPGGGTSRAHSLLQNLKTSLSSIMQKNWKQTKNKREEYIVSLCMIVIRVFVARKAGVK